MTRTFCAAPTCAQSGQTAHTLDVGHACSAAGVAYASCDKTTARSASVGEKTATVEGLSDATVKGAEAAEIPLVDATM